MYVRDDNDWYVFQSIGDGADSTLLGTNKWKDAYGYAFKYDGTNLSIGDAPHTFTAVGKNCFFIVWSGTHWYYIKNREEWRIVRRVANTEPMIATFEAQEDSVVKELSLVHGRVERTDTTKSIEGVIVRRKSMYTFKEFSTLVFNAPVKTGAWYYEVTIRADSLAQLGWANASFVPRDKSGVGECQHSWGYDGHRVLKWVGVKKGYGKRWKVGDIVGVLLNINEKTISFSMNGFLGRPMGVVKRQLQASGYFRAIISGHPGFAVSLNFGQSPLAYLPAGYTPMWKAWEELITKKE